MYYKLVIFDFDGTLADSFPFFRSALNTLADAYSFKRIEENEVDQLRSLDVRSMMKHVGLPAWKMPFVANAFIKLMSSNIDQIRLFAGVPELLKQLSDKGVRLAIVSSNSEENIRRVLGPQNASLITYYGCGTAMFGKSRKFRKVMAKSGVAPSEILCIGDEVRDMEAANSESMAFGAVAWGYTRADVLRAYTGSKLFNRIDDILHTVLGENKSTMQ
ncbi:HAD hydrolase-like protein [Spirosoma sp. HMF3257]|uniref:HAD family hydrolase n=1 Tax=Spirosoma telluris TaxID=2183553 RepID=A0A327NQP4_9BACT|nr:HAD hydrolase-like protein [Spirosoma telluris]RAI77700.1 HAD family hydrolase [Spirosoma telluris]